VPVALPVTAPKPAPAPEPAVPAVAATPASVPSAVKKPPAARRPHKVIPAGTIVTRDQLFARIFALEKRLGQVGDNGGQLLARLGEARNAAKQAATNDERLEVARTLDDVEVLLQ
jgi:hypothetical protein